MREYTLIRASRKSLSLRIGSHGEIIVCAPRLYPKFLIESWIEKKSDWIEKQRAHMRKKKKESDLEKDFFFLFGIPHPRGEKTPREIDQLQRDELRKYSEMKVGEYRNTLKIDKAIGKIRISTARTRWGSCSGRGTLSFSLMLHRRSISFIDAVILHELAHLYHMNHSQKFWDLLIGWIPEYHTIMKEASRDSSPSLL